MCILPNFLGLHFGENFMKIQTKTPKLQVHENLFKNVNENTFFVHIFMEILKQQICCSFTLLISYMVFDPFQMAFQFF